MTGQRDGVALRHGRALVLTCLVFAAACLVTNDVEYKVVNSPPSLVAVSPPPLTRAPLNSNPDCPMSIGRTMMKFDLTIYDEDVDQDLKIKVLVNGIFTQGIGVPPASGATARRTLPEPLCLDTSLFVNPCTLVEVLVTSEWADTDPNAPLTPGDLDRETWFVQGSPMSNADANSSHCEALLDAGVP